MNCSVAAPRRGLVCLAALVLCALMLCAMPATPVFAASTTTYTENLAYRGQGTLRLAFEGQMKFDSGVIGTVLTLTPQDSSHAVVYMTGTDLNSGVAVWEGSDNPSDLVNQGNALTINLNMAGVTLVTGATYQVTIHLLNMAASLSQLVDAGSFTVPPYHSYNVSMVSARGNLSHAGGGVTVTLSGSDLPTGIPVRATGVGSDLVLNADNGTDTARGADFVFPENTTPSPQVYTIQFSRDGGLTWEGSPSTTVTVNPKGTISSFVLDDFTMPASGGQLGYTISGSNLWGPIWVGVFKAETPDTLLGYSVVNQTSDPATVTSALGMPRNESTAADAGYVLKVSLDGGKTWESAPTATVTVSKAVRHPGGAGITSPATGGQTGSSKVEYGLWNDGSQYIAVYGNKNNIPNISYRSSVHFEKFSGYVEFDGTSLSLNREFTAAPGSTIINLNAAFLRNQTYSVHRLRVWFIDGYADLIIDLRALEGSTPPATPANTTTAAAVAASPQTGDAGSATYVGLAVLALAGVGIGAALGRRRQKTNP